MSANPMMSEDHVCKLATRPNIIKTIKSITHPNEGNELYSSSLTVAIVCSLHLECSLNMSQLDLSTDVTPTPVV